MSGSDKTRELAEAHWNQHVEPVLKSLFTDTFLAGAAVVPSVIADWVAAMPISPAAEPSSAVPPPAPAPRVRSAPAGHAEGAPAPLRRRLRPLKGASAAAYDAVTKAGKPLTSRELLGRLREWDGGSPSEARDNSLLAAMRRLRNSGWLDFDGTHYSIPPG
ncbi:hypothetical protein FHR71_004245 [Methylobacterium sp. RAS18]|nr:hypothetical protein [Methylobacterium sp. RAS18]